MKNSLLAGLFALALGAGSMLGAAPAKPGEITGKVVETMNAATYTYVLVDTGKAKVWAAAPQFAVKTGDTVAVAEAMPMANYQSKTLNRTFDVVYFSGSVTVNDARVSPPPAAAEMPAGHGAMPGAMKGTAVDLANIKRAPNGQTVVEIHANKTKLAGKPIALRGRVVKYNAQIMGKNWLHVRDGSGTEGTNDLTITTAATVKVGDLVLVTGTLAADRNFGSGYKYALIVEDAKVVVE
jgi:ribosomal protein S17